jgi:serine/threonine protein kinase
MYEMLAGYPPFYDEDPMKTYAKIIAGRVVFPSHISRVSCDLIKQLLHPKPTKRLGAIAGGANAVKSHAFFRGFDWDAFLRFELKAPIIPKVKNDTDISNFDKYPPMAAVPPQYKGCAKYPTWDADF